MSQIPSWTHPILGTFACRYGIWTKTVHLPAFKRFGFDPSEGKVNAGDVSLGIEAEKSCHLYAIHDDAPPTEKTISLCEDIIKSQECFADELLSAMWDDLLGEGPQSGMWWHGQRDTLNAENEEAAQKVRNTDYLTDPSLKRLQHRTDLCDIMGLPGILVCNPNDRCNVVHAIFGFATTFEVEHGVGIMSNGTQILGIGYSISVSQFKSSTDAG